MTIEVEELFDFTDYVVSITFSIFLTDANSAEWYGSIYVKFDPNVDEVVPSKTEFCSVLPGVRHTTLEPKFTFDIVYGDVDERYRLQFSIESTDTAYIEIKRKTIYRVIDGEPGGKCG